MAVCACAIAQDTTWKPEETGKWLSNSLVQVLCGGGALLLLLPPSFVKIPRLEVLSLCPVPTAHASNLMSEAWVDFLFLNMNSLELQPSPCPAEVMML